MPNEKRGKYLPVALEKLSRVTKKELEEGVEALLQSLPFVQM